LKGEVVCTYFGDIIDENEKDKRYDMISGRTADRLLQIRPYGREIQVFIDGSTCSIGTYANSNYGTNKENNVIFVERRLSSDDSNEDYVGLVELRALKKIKQNEEILVDYGEGYWKGDENNKKIIKIKESEEWSDKQGKESRLLKVTSNLILFYFIDFDENEQKSNENENIEKIKFIPNIVKEKNSRGFIEF
jgi:hypothetical protein